MQPEQIESIAGERRLLALAPAYIAIVLRDTVIMCGDLTPSVCWSTYSKRR